MRQALNNLQSTFEGFGYVNSTNVFKVQCSSLIFILSSVYFKYAQTNLPQSTSQYILGM